MRHDDCQTCPASYYALGVSASMTPCLDNEGWQAVRTIPHLVGKPPEQKRHDDRPPELGHDVEQAEGPVPEDGDGPGKAGAPLRQQLL